MKTYIVYYMKPESFGRFNFGQEFPTVVDLHNTHKRVRLLVANDQEDAFYQMQGEVWSPNGEQRTKIKALGLQHTSMSVGDVLYERINNKYFVVAPCGFKEMN